MKPETELGEDSDLSNPQRLVSVGAVIVTHNSPPILERAVRSLLTQTEPIDHLVIVDSGSREPHAVRSLAALDERIKVICTTNVGFAAGNNLGLRECNNCDFFLLLNPDAILADDWVASAREFLSRQEGRAIGILSSPLRGMDATTARPTGLWDSLGIYRSNFGGWRDSGMHQPIEAGKSPLQPYEPTAVCGALMFFSADFYKAMCGPFGFFDERFHTYKEDIDLSLRAKRSGFRLLMLPQLLSWHCRGWPSSRHRMPFKALKQSARNELLISARYLRLGLPISIAKYIYVITLERVWLEIFRLMFFK